MTQKETERLRSQFQSQPQLAYKSLLSQAGVYCVTEVQQRAGCTRDQAEHILFDAILDFREKVLTGKFTGTPDLREYLFLSCWEIWRQRRDEFDAAIAGDPPEVLDRQALIRILRAQFGTQIAQKFRDKPEAYTRDLLQAVKQALDLLPREERDILWKYYRHRCNLPELARQMQLSSEEEAKVFKSNAYRHFSENLEALLL